MTTISNDLLERIETRMAFLERANNDLSDVVYRQQQEISQLREHLAALLQRVDSVQAAAPDPDPAPPEDEKPPHY